MGRRGETGRGAVAVLLALGIGIALGAGGGYYWFRVRPAAPVPAARLPPVTAIPSPLPSPSPSSVAAPSDPPQLEITTMVEPAPPALPAASSPAAPRPAGRKARAASAGVAVAATRPLPPPAVPRTPPELGVPSPEAPARDGRRFVLGATSVESRKPIGADLKGFEPEGVVEKRGPAVNGHLLLEMDPPQPSPGKPYVVRVYLKNDGRRSIDVTDMKVSTVANGTTIEVPVIPEHKAVPARARTLLRELPGTWKQATDTWAMVVVVTSRREDVYTNRLTWK